MIRLPLGYDEVICLEELESPEGVPQWRILFGHEGTYFRNEDDELGEYFVEPFKEAKELSKEVSSNLPELLKKLSQVMKIRNMEI